MTITIESNIINKGVGAQVSSGNLKEAFIKLLKEKGEYNKNNLVWNDDNQVELKNMNSLTLHKFILMAEQFGKTVKMEKKLTIKIED